MHQHAQPEPVQPDLAPPTSATVLIIRCRWCRRYLTDTATLVAVGPSGFPDNIIADIKEAGWSTNPHEVGGQTSTGPERGLTGEARVIRALLTAGIVADIENPYEGLVTPRYFTLAVAIGFLRGCQRAPGPVPMRGDSGRAPMKLEIEEMLCKDLGLPQYTAALLTEEALGR